MASLHITGNTDVGKFREDNQDLFICEFLDWPKRKSRQLALLTVIDGVGGYMGGEVAASIAQKCIANYMSTPKGEIPSMLREAIVYANNQIVEESKSELKLAQMSCVLTVAVIDVEKQKLYFIHVGDTRLYRYQNNKIEKLTLDHSSVGIWEDTNKLTEEEAMNHPRRNEILRDVGSEIHQINDINFFDEDEINLLPDDILLLCSDGLTDMVNRAQINAILRQDISLDEKVSTLIETANQQGGKDNITVVLAYNESSNVANFSAIPENNSNVVTQQTSIQTIELIIKQKNRHLAKMIAGYIGIVLLVFLMASDSVIHFNIKPIQNSSSNLVPLAQGTITPLKNEWDTLWVHNPISLTDTTLNSNNGKYLIVMPDDTAKADLAFYIKRGSTVTMENIEIRNFKTGILIEDNVALSLRNIRFNKVAMRLRIINLTEDTLTNLKIMFNIKADTIVTPTTYP